MERIILKTDAAITRVETIISRVDEATENIKNGLQAFAEDVIGFLKSCGLLAKNQHQQVDEEMGIKD